MNGEMLQMNTQPMSGASGPGTGSTRACQNCSRAKSKCLPQTDTPDGKCARCSRLNKECTVLPRSARKRRSPNNASSTAQLEQKIESLVSLLSSQGVPIRQSHLTPPESHDSGQSPSEERDKSVAEFPTPEQRWAPVPTEATRHHSWISQNPARSEALAFVGGTDLFPPCLNHSGQEIGKGFPQRNSNVLAPQSLAPFPDSARLLKTFKEQFSPHFPFVIIPNLSADQLRSQRPWLYRAVMMVASQDDRFRQIEMSKQMLMDISTAMLLRGEKSLDMLQGLILYNSWSYYYSPVIPSIQSTGIHQLALALLYDMNLTKPTREGEGPLGDIATANKTLKEVQPTSDERRALLSVYFLTSVTAFCLKKLEGLRYSPYIEHCCDVLTEAAEYESDLLLASLVKLQNIVEPINRVFTDKSKIDETKAPVWMVVKLVQADMQSFWSSLPPRIQQNRILLMSYNSAEVFTYEPSMHKSFFRAPSLGSTDSLRLDMLYGCLISTQKLASGYIERPLSDFAGASVIDLAHLGRGLSTLLKLSLLEDVGWDLVHVRQTANLSYYFNELSARFAQVGEELDQKQTRSVRERATSFPTGCSRAMKMVQNWYEGRIAVETGEPLVQEPVPLTGMEDVMVDDTFDYMNDANWLDLLGDCNFTMPV